MGYKSFNLNVIFAAVTSKSNLSNTIIVSAYVKFGLRQMSTIHDMNGLFNSLTIFGYHMKYCNITFVAF